MLHFPHNSILNLSLPLLVPRESEFYKSLTQIPLPSGSWTHWVQPMKGTSRSKGEREIWGIFIPSPLLCLTVILALLHFSTIPGPVRGSFSHGPKFSQDSGNTTHFLFLSWSKDNSGFLLVVVSSCLRILRFPWPCPHLSKLPSH